MLKKIICTYQYNILPLHHNNKTKGEYTMRETFMADNASAKSMNKVMFFMANCGYDEVKKLCYKAFDKNLAEHIFNKYLEKCEYSGRPFFELYFDVDSDCKRKICNYITKNYHSEGQLKDVYPTSEQRATEFAQIIDDNINISPRTDTPIVEYCTGGGMHRYTQNEFFKLIIKLIKGWADACDKGWWDGRNEYACKLSKKLAEVIDNFILE